MTTNRETALIKITSSNRESCLSYFAHGKLVWNRLLNGFPNLIADDELLSYTETFQELLKKIESGKKFDDMVQAIQAVDEIKVRQWGILITASAIQFLLEEKNIQKDVMKALGLENKIKPSDPEFIYALVSSLVGNIILEQIMSPLETMILSHQNAYHSLCAYINKNYPHWVTQSLKKIGVDIKYEQVTQTPFIFKVLSEPKKAVTAVALLAGIAAVGYALFNKKEFKQEHKEKAELKDTISKMVVRTP